MASASNALPSAPRCDRPSARALNCSGVHPGGFAHGPDEKRGLAALVLGLLRRTTTPAAAASVIRLSFQRARAALGRRYRPTTVSGNAATASAKDSRTIHSYAAMHNELILLRFAYVSAVI